MTKFSFPKIKTKKDGNTSLCILISFPVLSPLSFDRSFQSATNNRPKVITQLFRHSHIHTQKNLQLSKSYDVPLKNYNNDKNGTKGLLKDWLRVCMLVRADFVLLPGVQRALLSCWQNKTDEQLGKQLIFHIALILLGECC
jgi:hypothetical protein